MLALADSDYNFLFADIGTHGRISDRGVFSDSLLCQKINENEVFPESIPLPARNMPMPYVFVSDAAFALSKRLMKPCPGVPPCGSQQRIFNQQLSRARVVIECSFGMRSVLECLQNLCCYNQKKQQL